MPWANSEKRIPRPSLNSTLASYPRKPFRIALTSPQARQAEIDMKAATQNATASSVEETVRVAGTRE
jgi:hypothetical protein